MGSAGIAALIARWGFWLLLIYGWAWGELGRTALGTFAVLWLVGFLVRPMSPLMGDSLFTAYVAVLDVALVFRIFRSDLRI
jgi:hypothetical protein